MAPLKSMANAAGAEKENICGAPTEPSETVFTGQGNRRSSPSQNSAARAAQTRRAQKKYGSGVPQVFMCLIIWQCTLTPPQPSTAAMAGILNTPAAEAHPPVTSSVQPRSKFAQSGRRSRGIYWAAQANMTIHAHIEILSLIHI